MEDSTPESRIVEFEPTPELNPWTSIWFKPRETMDFLLATNPKRSMFLLLAVSGIAQVLDKASEKNMGDQVGLGIILLTAFVLGPLLAILFLYPVSGLMGWVGRWLDGKASNEAIRTVIAWSNVPMVVVLLFWMIQIPLYGMDLFTQLTPNLDASWVGLSILLLVMILGEIALAIWSYVIFFRALAQVQGFSIGRAILNAVLAFLVFFIPMVFVALMLAFVVSIFAG